MGMSIDGGMIIGEAVDDIKKPENFDGDYYVTEVLRPVIYSQEFSQVVSEACPDETLIALHSHPYKQCLASEQDLSNLEISKGVNPNALIGIICEEDRFSFYS